MTEIAKGQILVVEDDESIQLGLRMTLEANGYSVRVAGDGRTGLELALTRSSDLMILDIMLPEMNGYELLRRLKEEYVDIPVLILSARSGDDDKVVGLDLGAEDYITKPFSVPELLARVRAALRRRRRPPRRLSFGANRIDPASRSVIRDGAELELTATEYDVLWVLTRARGGPLSRQQIFDAVWGPNHHGTKRTIDNFVAQLRSKIEDDPGQPEHLVTVRGVGYRLALD